MRKVMGWCGKHGSVETEIPEEIIDMEYVPVCVFCKQEKDEIDKMNLDESVDLSKEELLAEEKYEAEKHEAILEKGDKDERDHQG